MTLPAAGPHAAPGPLRNSSAPPRTPRPGATPGLGNRVRQTGVRDVPSITRPFATLEATTPAAVLHLIFREDPRTPIGTLYES